MYINVLKNLALLVGSLILFILLLEFVLSFFPVMDITRTKPLNENSKPFDVSSESNKLIEYSSGWNFKNRRVRKTNNDGFFSDYDYDDGEQGIFVVGDSYVEAVQVDFKETFHQVAANLINAKIYNIGIAGSPLSQYEAYVSQICEDYAPKTIIISVVGNDFDESLYETRLRSGFFHYRNNELLPTDYSISRLRRIASSSSVTKYLFFHLNVGLFFRSSSSNITHTKSGSHEFAIKQFLTNMTSYCLPPENIIFVVDANRGRGGVYTDNKQLVFMEHFISEASKYSFPVIDLHHVMRADYENNKTRFEFQYDGHWNAYAHKLVGEEVARVVGSKRLFPYITVENE